MENVVTRESPAELFRSRYAGQRVFVTGHTGFKGGWLCEWLLHLGAEVAGYSLEPNTTPALFDELNLGARMHHQIGDIRTPDALKRALADFRPAYVFHLAAQPLVRLSYAQPVDTFETNIMGTVHVLEAVAALRDRCSVVVVTTDKCYRNNETGEAFTEDDPLGGHDPYSASKAGTEIVVSAYRDSFFSGNGSQVALASARAGNVIGGGDWALDRIIPDAVRALAANQSINVRNPSHIRPWQHVLDPLGGYLLLGAMIDRSPSLRTAFNFGPDASSSRTVRELVEEILRHWPGRWHSDAPAEAAPEMSVLRLGIEKARSLLHWQPTWGFAQAVERTITWYRSPEDARSKTRAQIEAFESEMAFTR
jgi:CDP-glucose 4,6-dehydratase